MAPGELRAGRHGQALRPGQRERLARARSPRLAGPGLQRQRGHLDHDRQQDGAELRPAVPDQGVRHPEHHGLRRIPAQRHREPERRDHPAGRVPALRRQPRRPAERADGRRGRQRADQRLQRQDRRGLHRPQGAPVCGTGHRRGRRQGLGQGLRRRHPGRGEDRALVPDLPGAHQGRPALPQHVCVRRPRLHRRHLPVRPARRRPARLRDQPPRPGHVQGALRQPVEPAVGPDRWRRRRQDHRPDPRRLRQPGRTGRLRWLDRRPRRP